MSTHAMEFIDSTALYPKRHKTTTKTPERLKKNQFKTEQREARAIGKMQSSSILGYLYKRHEVGILYFALFSSWTAMIAWMVR